MAFLIKCSECNFKFFDDIEDAISPLEIIRKYMFRCPSCYKKLEYNPKNITIKSSTNKPKKINIERARLIEFKKQRILFK